MSMNLCFMTVEGNHFVDFPFQTPTSLTYEVYEKSTKELQLLTIENFVKSCKWDSHSTNRVMKECRELLFDPTLRLCII